MYKWILLVSLMVLTQWFFPWYVMFPIGIAFGWFALTNSKPYRVVASGALAGLVVWTTMSWIKDMNMDYAITERLAAALPVHGVFIYLATGLIAFFAMGLSTHVGTQLRRTFS